MTSGFEDEDAILVDDQDCHSESTMSRMFNPPHPGATLKEDVLPALGLSVTAAAQQLGVTRAVFSRAHTRGQVLTCNIPRDDHGGRIFAA